MREGSAVALSLILVLSQAACAIRTSTAGMRGENSTDTGRDVVSASQLDRSALGEDYVPTSPSIRAYVPSDQEVDDLLSIPGTDMTAHVTPDASLASGTVGHPQGLDPSKAQVLYLWEKDNVPGSDVPRGADATGFRPAVTTVPVTSGARIKGAVLLEAGGAFLFRGSHADAYPVAERLSCRGYQCFVVDYRLDRDLGAIDLARALRFVRAHWQDYGLPGEDAIAVMGFSAGGIAAGQMLLDWGETKGPQGYDETYAPDDLDLVSARAAADAMIYSFYGRLSVASRDVGQLRAADLPPTYFVYGSRDPFVHEFEANVQALEQAGVTVEGVALRGWPHGFGATGGWMDGYDAFLQNAFEKTRRP